MTVSKWLLVFAIGVTIVCAATAALLEAPEDDPRQMIADWNNEHGQLRPLTPNDEDTDVYDAVSSAEEFAESDEEDLSVNPEFPPALQFNTEGNRIHKLLPVADGDEDYQLPQNKMIQIADGV